MLPFGRFSLLLLAFDLMIMSDTKATPEQKAYNWRSLVLLPGMGLLQANGPVTPMRKLTHEAER